jgi:hypothetical protein
VLPKLDNCGMYWAKTNDGNWHYLNHAKTWQRFQGPYAGNAQRVIMLLEECRGWVDLAGDMCRDVDSILERIDSEIERLRAIGGTSSS